MALSNFSESARLGFLSGEGQGSQNPLGSFVRNMLAAQQQRQEMEGKIGVAVGIEKAKSQYELQNIQKILGDQATGGQGGGQTGGFQPSKFTYGGITFEDPQFKAKEESAKKAGEVKNEMDSIDNMVNVVWQKADELIPAATDLKQGAWQGLGRDIGKTKIARLVGKGDENTIAFTDFQEGTLSMLIRSLGEKGMLTDKDIQRARQFEPNTWDSINVRSKKKTMMSDFLKSKVNAYYNNMNFNKNPITQGAEMETFIKENMQHYGKSREEVIAALKKKGLM